MNAPPLPKDAERQWKRAIEEHATVVVRQGFAWAAHALPTIRLAPDNGGLVVDVQGPDGAWRSFYVRLTEVVK